MNLEYIYPVKNLNGTKIVMRCIQVIALISSLLFYCPSIFAVKYNDDQIEMLKCTATYNQTSKHFYSLSAQEKFDFTLKVLEHSYGKKVVADYFKQKEQALKSPEKIDSFFNAVIMEITEACVVAVDKKINTLKQDK
jgi:hypothetical protein